MGTLDIRSSTHIEGCVLDEPNCDLSVPILHHIYCRNRNAIFLLTRHVFNNFLSQAVHDDWNYIDKDGLAVGAFISFTFDLDNQVTSFKLSNKSLKVDIVDGKKLFRSLCVFNKEFTKVFTEDFDTFDINHSDILNLNDIPTSNIAIEMYIEWKHEGRKIVPNIYKFIGLASDDQAFVARAKWNVSTTTSEYKNEFYGDVQPTNMKKAEVRIESGKRGFITGLTSIFVSDLFSYSVLLPSHNRKFHSIGRAAQCDLVYNEVRKAYGAYNMEPVSCSNYYTILMRKSDTVEGIFYVDLNTDMCLHGLYQHDFFRLIADPFGFLDLVRFARNENDTTDKKRILNIPIKDRLAKTNEHQTVQDMDIITRFEITSAGDDSEQIEFIENLRNREARLEGGGIVINKDTGLVCGHQFSGIVFKLSGPHNYENGTPIVFKATRVIDLDVTRPTFLITAHKRKKMPGNEPFCTFADGKFYLKAKFDAHLNCYEALNMFGYIPIKVPPPFQEPRFAKCGEQTDRIYEIRAEENTHLPAQTVLFHGEFVREL